MKRIEFSGDSLELVREFPDAVRKEIGVQLHKVQLEIEPSNWKLMSSIDRAREIRVQSDDGFAFCI